MLCSPRAGLVLLPCVAIATLSLPVAVAADAPSPELLDEVIVTASRAPGGLGRSQLGTAVTTFDARTLEQRQVRALADLLRDVPGAAVSQAGPWGSVTQLRLRGSEANHVLVLVDGMQATDPFYGEFDFALLMADPLARLEILRGQQSALYGSDAIGGVVHYLTPGGREAPGLTARAEAGSFQTWQLAARQAGVQGAWDYAVSAGLRETGGSPSARLGTRDLGARNTALALRLARDAGERWRLRLDARYLRSAADFNQQDYDFSSPTYGYVVDTDDRSDQQLLLARAALESAPAEGWQQSLQLQTAQAQRHSETAGQRSDGNEGGRWKASYVLSRPWRLQHWQPQLTLALDAQRERFRNTAPYATPAQRQWRQLDNLGLVAQLDLPWGDRAALGAAFRHDRNDRFSDADTYRLQGSLRLGGGLRLRGAAGAGIKNPTPTEVFGYDPDSFIGNPDLMPEVSRGWELALAQDLADGRLRWDLAWVQSELHHEVYTTYSPTFVASPANRRSTSTQQGIELSLAARPTDAWQLDLAYGWLRAREDGTAEVRRPPHSGSLQLAWAPPGGRGSLQAGWRYNGRTRDYNFTASGPYLVPMRAYSLLQLGGQWQLNEHWQLQGRVENLLAQRYEDVYTYRMPGRSVHIGLRANL